PEIRRKYGVSPDKLLIVNTGNGLGEDSYLQRHNSNVDQVKPQLYIEFLKRLPEFERRASSTDQCLMYEWAVVFVSGSVPQRTTLNDKSFLETIAGQGRAARAGIGLVKM
ncbi:MAG TPA: hypothetical protein VJI97_00760, partial [Candidatus Nanoarchaeia archaeon]|nr:hypothetical protein [Candidatus Nanoarchaeia archaeon]